MSVYVTSLFYAIPTFMVLISLEALVAKLRGIEVNRSEDMIASLSSGLTNTIRDGLKFTFAIISYTWLVDKIAIFKVEPMWLAVVIAFVVKDFSGYWVHRMNHRVNILWNRHVIHHSSEDFNLSCALRQSISNTIKFSAIFMVPAALLGVPAKIFAVLGPIHLFLQFWYHTQLINKMGWLEYILVTPSHHRVHHAINPEYIDKNYSQIFIIWDKLFGTFQPELEDVKPVYGTLAPSKTWNPILINFKHIWQLIKDAWRTVSFRDKLIIWFMPTGWRPRDVEERYPLEKITDPYKRVKYSVENSIVLVGFSWLHLMVSLCMMLHLFVVAQSISIESSVMYAMFLMVGIFAYTSTLDGGALSIPSELVKILFGAYILISLEFSWFGLGVFFSYAIGVYLLISFLISLKFKTAH